MPRFFNRIKSSIIMVTGAALSLSNPAQAQDSSRACERWLCMPGSTTVEVFLNGSNPFSAGCITPYLDYAFWRVPNPFQAAMTNFENCIRSDYSNRHPEIRVRSDVDRPGFFGGSWEEYELEVFENGRKKGELKFEHHENRAFQFIIQDDPRRRVVRDVESSGEFGRDFLFPLGR